LFYSLVALVVVFDQLTKFLAIQYLNYYDSVPIIPQVFHLTLVRNTGVAFGLFRQHPSWLLILISLSILALGLWSFQIKQASRPVQTGLALILGGAIGNWIDRMRAGSVIDFLDFRVWPVFNMADSAITIGTCLYLWILVKGKRGL
jgi:signal peptidase II